MPLRTLLAEFGKIQPPIVKFPNAVFCQITIRASLIYMPITSAPVLNYLQNRA